MQQRTLSNNKQKSKKELTAESSLGNCHVHHFDFALVGLVNKRAQKNLWEHKVRMLFNVRVYLSFKKIYYKHTCIKIAMPLVKAGSQIGP